jgi:hypothetical protein
MFEKGGPPPVLSLVTEGPPRAVKGPDIRMGLLGAAKELDGLTKASFPAL